MCNGHRESPGAQACGSAEEPRNQVPSHKLILLPTVLGIEPRALRTPGKHTSSF